MPEQRSLPVVDSPDIILVTRSGNAGRGLVARLREAGWPAHDGCPLRLTGPQDPTSLRADFARLQPFDRMVLTSSEGARQAVSLFGAAALSACPVIVPGPGSRALATSLGLEQVHCPPSAGDSEAMLALPELTEVSGRHVLILAAAGGRQLLATRLQARGARVSHLHVYRRLARALPAATLHALGEARRPLTLLASAGALHGLGQQLPAATWQRLLDGIMVAPSTRVAAKARRLGCAQVRQAAGADDEAMLSALFDATSDAKLR